MATAHTDVPWRILNVDVLRKKQMRDREREMDGWMDGRFSLGSSLDHHTVPKQSGGVKKKKRMLMCVSIDSNYAWNGTMFVLTISSQMNLHSKDLS